MLKLRSMGCPGWPHRPYEDSATNFRAIWSYMASKSPFFNTFPVNWHFKVVEMAFKTIHFIPGLSRTPLSFIPRYLTNIFFEHILQKQQISRIENLKISKVDPGKFVDSFSPRDGPVIPSNKYGKEIKTVFKPSHFVGNQVYGNMALHYIKK